MKTSRFRIIVAYAGCLLSAMVVLSAMIAGFGSRAGWWHFGAGFMILRISGYAGIAAAVISLTGFFLSFRHEIKNAVILSCTGLVISLTVVYNLWNWQDAARNVPMIHDISTDTDNPPMFIKVQSLRAEATNSIEYGGHEVAEKQHEAYPRLSPLQSRLPSRKTFGAAVKVAKKMEWEVLNEDAMRGIIEATDVTFWFGFKDDIVIRVTPNLDGSLVDVRSVSRVGLGDAGTNAARIKKFMYRLQSELSRTSPS